MCADVTAYSDSDWAGCKETRKFSSAGVILLGSHILQACTRKEEIIAVSSTESELHAVALDASESKAIVSLLPDLGYVLKFVLAITHSPQTRDLSIETHRGGSSMDSR